jgi:hypothetical protein
MHYALCIMHYFLDALVASRRSSLSREASNRQVIGIDYVGLQQL